MEIPFRIIVLCPPAGVSFRLQQGRSGLVAPSSATADAISFDFTLRAEPDGPDGRPRLLGPFAQGPPAARFVYVSSGKRAGQADSCWDRRAKVPLLGVEAAMIAEAAGNPNAVIEARIAGTGRDGGPACATVPVINGWRVVV